MWRSENCSLVLSNVKRYRGTNMLRTDSEGAIIVALVPLGRTRTPCTEDTIYECLVHVIEAVTICFPEIQNAKGAEKYSNWKHHARNVMLRAGAGALLGTLVGGAFDLLGPGDTVLASKTQAPFMVFWKEDKLVERFDVGASTGAALGLGVGFAAGVADVVVEELMNRIYDEPASIACTAIVSFRAACSANGCTLSAEEEDFLKDTILHIKEVTTMMPFQDADKYISILDNLKVPPPEPVIIALETQIAGFLHNAKALDMWWPSTLQYPLPVQVSEDGLTVTVSRPHKPLFPPASEVHSS